jgi:hypothetical protein
MAQTQKMYLGGVPVIKNYFGENPIVSNGAFPVIPTQIVTSGLLFYFNSKLGANATNWLATVGNKTGSYDTVATYYNATDKVVELDGGNPTFTTDVNFAILNAITSSHTILMFTKPKRANSKQYMEFQGQAGGTNLNTSLQLRNDVDSTNYFVYENQTRYTYIGSQFGAIPLEQWQMFGYGVDGSTQADVDLFYNNQTTPVTGSAAAFSVVPQYWSAGNIGGATSTDYSGSMGAIFVYNRKLTLEETTQNYIVLSNQFS